MKTFAKEIKTIYFFATMLWVKNVLKQFYCTILQYARFKDKKWLHYL